MSTKKGIQRTLLNCLDREYEFVGWAQFTERYVASV